MSANNRFPEVRQVNENTLIIYFSDNIDIKMPTRIAAVIHTIKNWPDDVIIDYTPSYTSLLINFDELKIDFFSLNKRIQDCLSKALSANQIITRKRIEIPVYYSIESGLDLEQTAHTLGTSVEQVIQLHCEPEYLVFALGFMPGFAFMGIVNEKLRLPRLSTPRTAVPKGSVAIAEQQTAVYPQSTPGGWRILGKSPMCLFDASLNPPQSYKIGDSIKFVAIGREEFLNLGGTL